MAPGNQLYLDRPRIDKLLETAVQSPIVEVIAGAGYGKTHAVYSFLRRRGDLTAWMQLSGRDNIADRFWENFVQTVTFMGKDSVKNLEKIDFPDTDLKFNRYLTIPQNAAVPGKKHIFVYDDFHLLYDKSVLHFMERSLTSPFPTITSIIISRNEPKVNFLPSMSKGFLARISEEDLRFTREEMIAYFKLLNIHVSQEILTRVYRDTEGWAFAIHLAALALKNDREGKGYALAAVRSNVFKLLESEVMANISPGLRIFLIKLSFFEHLPADLLADLMEQEGCPEFIDEIERIGSFIRYDIYTNSWQIHQLFLAYLRGKQNEISEDEKQSICFKAAAWYEKNDLKMDAISYYEKAGAYGKIFEVVNHIFPLILSSRIARFLKEILDRAPEKIYREYPPAWILYSRILLALEQFEKATNFLNGIIKTLEEEEMTQFHYRVLTGCYVNLGIIGMFTSLHTRDYTYARHFEKACYYYRLSAYPISGSITVFTLAPNQCRVNVPERGEIEKSLEAITETTRYLSEVLGGCSYGLDDLCHGELAYARTEVSAAEGFFLRSLTKAREKGQYEIEHRALFYLLRIALFRGDLERIRKYFDQMESLLEKTDFLNRYVYHDIYTGWFYVQIGLLEKTAPWLKNDYEGSDLNSLAFGFETLVRAKYYLSEKRYRAALTAIESRKSSYSMMGYLMGIIMSDAVSAICRYRLQDKSGAIRALESAWDQASPNGLDMIFIEMGREMRALTAAALKDPCCRIPRDWLEKVQRTASAYAKKVFAVSEAYQTLKQGRQESAGLSAWELEVLTGLSQGFTREEIAEASAISVNTVKSVIRSIYAKLGAVNRADAIRIAAGAGLLKIAGKE
jgi:LuxR family maltose regulon positive regulatory protein